MKPEEQRIAIAKACGWTKTPFGEFREWNPKTWRYLSDLPDYLNDLNAMHEAEKMLTESQESEFADRLNILHEVADLTYPKPNMQGFRKALFSEAFYLIHTTAAQRAEAFLKTLGLWEESK